MSVSAIGIFFCEKKGKPCSGFPLVIPIFWLSTQTKLFDDSSVSLDVSLPEVVKDTASLTNESQK